MLTGTFLNLVCRYTADTALANALWLELFSRYSESGRHYHTTDHLAAMLAHLQKVKDRIAKWDTVLFALFYHDVIYKVPGANNESESAKFARERLVQIGFPEEQIGHCERMIVATKEHLASGDGDTDYLLDADLAVLGALWADYRKYAAEVREEYARFPDFLYIPGRRKVLRHFLEADRIYKTPEFARFEPSARRNLQAELDELG